MDSLRFRCEKGVSIIAVMVMLGSVGIAMAVFMARLEASKSMHVRSSAKMNFQMARTEMLTHVNNLTVWDETIAQNPVLNCFRNSTCTDVLAHDLVLYSISKLPISGGTSAGFDIMGRACKTAADNCAVKVHVQYRPMCDAAATCLNPLIEVTGRFVNSNLLQTPPVSLELYEIVTYRRLF
jgi:hypothetical protein